MVFINVVSVNDEAIRMIDKSRQDPGPLHRCLGQGVRRIDSDNLHSPGFGWVVKEHKEGLHALDLNVRFRSAMGGSRTLGAAPGGGWKEGCHERDAT